MLLSAWCWVGTGCIGIAITAVDILQYALLAHAGQLVISMYNQQCASVSATVKGLCGTGRHYTTSIFYNLDQKEFT